MKTAAACETEKYILGGGALVPDSKGVSNIRKRISMVSELIIAVGKGSVALALWQRKN